MKTFAESALPLLVAFGCCNTLGKTTATHGPKPASSHAAPKPVILAAGGYHTCISAGAAVRCWGANDRGQLGRGGKQMKITTLLPSLWGTSRFLVQSPRLLSAKVTPARY